MLDLHEQAFIVGRGDSDDLSTWLDCKLGHVEGSLSVKIFYWLLFLQNVMD